MWHVIVFSAEYEEHFPCACFADACEVARNVLEDMPGIGLPHITKRSS